MNNTKKKISSDKQTNLKTYIQVFKNVISKEDRLKIIKEYEQDDNWNEIHNTPSVSTDKSFQFIRLSDPGVINKSPETRKAIDEILYKSFANVYKEYNNLYNRAIVSKDNGYALLRYQVNNFYLNHADAFEPGTQMLLACTLLLNDNFKGGEFSFFNKKAKIKLKAGDALIYPCNFLYPHQVAKITTGVRYSVITWFA